VAYRLVVALATFLLGATGFAYLGTWGGSAGPVTYLRGQVPPELELPPPGWVPEEPPVRVRPRVGTRTIAGRVSPRYLSFAIDTSQLVGGAWWDPGALRKEKGTGTVPARVFDFDRPKLDGLVRALEPAYLRVGGSEADKLYYDLDDRLDAPPEGYDSRMRLEHWDGLQRFVKQHDLELVFTLNAGPSARGDGGAWQPDNAEHLLRHASRRGDQIARIELGNEANLFWYVFGPWHAASAEQYAEDLALSEELLETYVPGTKLTGQSSAFWPVIGEPLTAFYDFQEDYLREAAPHIDYVAWHYYPQQSRRCFTASRRAHPTRLLVPEHLDEVELWAEANVEWRDRYAPGQQLWMGETGNAQCGGEPGVSDRFIASLWWMDQLGLLARHDHAVVVRQTLSGMNYGMLSEPDLEPRPDYWASVLWKRLMGRDVLPVEVDAPTLRAYAHCTPDDVAPPGAYTLLAINLDPRRAVTLALDAPAQSYIVTAPDVLGVETRLGGRTLAVESTAGGGVVIPELPPAPVATAEPRLPPTSFGFFVLDRAAPACRFPDGGPESP